MGLHLVALPSRLLRGHTEGFPSRCSHPTCRESVDRRWAPLYVTQGTRHWTFCSAECLRGFIRLSELPGRHLDDMIDMDADA